MSEQTGPRRTKYYKDNPAAVAERNAARLLAMRMARTPRQSDWLELDAEFRLEYLQLARRMMAFGADFGTAERAEKVVTNGCIYVIDHPRLPGVKIGRAFDPKSRLRSYQTGCPERAYRLRFAAYFEDAHAVETTVHERLRAHQLEGEWFDLTAEDAQECIEYFARHAEGLAA